MTTPWFFHRDTSAYLQLSAFQELAHAALATPKQWEKDVAGGYQLFNLLTLPAGSLLQEQLTSAVKSLGGLELQFLTPKRFILLRAPPGSGPQPLHRDGLDPKHYTALLYLSHNRSAELGSSWTSTLQSYPTVPGSLLVFPEHTIHRGTKNEELEDRLVMFLVLGPLGTDHSDDRIEHYEWNEAAERYGRTSTEYYAALRRSTSFQRQERARRRQGSN
jgi:hypothetical protein